MDPLATVADCTARGLTVTTEEEPLLEVYLATASAAVREAAGCPISQTTSTITLDGGPDHRLRLPGPPITAVASVLIDGAAVDDWRLRRSSASLWRWGGWQGCTEPSDVEVTYTHGLPVVPADIVDLVCRIAAACLVAQRAEPDGEGLAAADIRQERIGDYAVTYGDTGLITEMELPDYLRGRLASRFGGGAAVVRTR
ncbi:hypothetical protein [Allonocardiopsis opalescens]|uniref:Phage gp6-like head-tail connector protein n=1 Tax=Allonocardiopsis opalescens TaxID=1144618 RepID=A0A2T0PPT8_9ACTN|nr:hypothetical protein [Allonocardiopsis opalescens]PRX90828.1 hypothetical protein CLV72_11624 [Allonocardiopsis opalescens]